MSSSSLAHFYLMKNSTKVRANRIPNGVWETPNHPPNIKCIDPAVFGDRFVEKDRGLRTHNPSAEEVR
jgi:hypothetical protein